MLDFLTTEAEYLAAPVGTLAGFAQSTLDRVAKEDDRACWFKATDGSWKSSTAQKEQPHGQLNSWMAGCFRRVLRWGPEEELVP